MRIFLKDVKYAWRSLLKRPLLAVTVATTLAFGLGANAAIFNLIDRMVLRPFPLADPDHTVLLSETGPRLDYGNKETVSPANFLDWRTSVGTLTHLSGIQWWDASLLERGNPERLQGFQVSSGFFDALGMRPALGRGFVRDDETFGRHRVAVLSDALWKRRFGADPTVVGRSITIDGEPYQVIGIGAGAVRLSRWFGDLGTARVRPEAGATTRRAIPHGDRPIALRKVRRGCADRDRGHRGPSRARISGREPRSRRPRANADAGNARPGHRADSCAMAGVSAGGAPHRVCEHRESDARQNRGTAARDRRTPCPRREPRTRHPGTADREYSARPAGGPARGRLRVGGAPLDSHQYAGTHSPVRSGVRDARARLAAAGLHHRPRPADRVGVWRPAGAASRTVARIRGAQRRRPNDRPSVAPPRDRGRGNVDRAAAARRRRPWRDRHEPVPEWTTGVRPERPADDEVSSSRAHLCR